MLEARKSLASYFDDPSPATWHEMTESGGGLQLEDWFTHPDGRKLFLPDGAKPADQPPADKEYHQYGKPFKPNQWGYTPDIAKKNKDARAVKKHKNQEKEDKKKLQRKEAATIREKRSKDIKEIHAKTMEIFMRQNAWQTHETDITRCMAKINQTLEGLKQQKDGHRAQVMADKAYKPAEGDSAEIKKDKIHKRNVAIYEQVATWPQTESTAMLENVAEYLASGKAAWNTFGMDIPQHGQHVEHDAETNYYYITVLIAYIGAIKHEVMSATVFKLKGQTNLPEANDFISESYKAKDILGKLLKKRKFKKLPKWRPDGTILAILHEYIGQREYELFMHTRKEGSAVPKHLQRYAPGWTPAAAKQQAKDGDKKKRKRVKKGKGESTTRPEDAMSPRKTEPTPDYRRGGHHIIPGPPPRPPRPASNRAMYTEPYY